MAAPTFVETTMQILHRGIFMPAFDRMRSGRALFIPIYPPKHARHGVKLYSQSGRDPRKQSAGRKDTHET